MLDTNVCSFIMREQPEAVIKRLEQAVLRNHRIVVSAITYAEMRLGAIGKKASPRHAPRCRAALGPGGGGRHHGNQGRAGRGRNADRPERYGDRRACHRRRRHSGDE